MGRTRFAILALILAAFAGAGVASAAPSRPEGQPAFPNPRAITVGQAGTTLTIEGDDASDNITLTSIDAGSVEVSGDGPAAQYSGVAEVVIDLGGGDDSLTVENEPSAFFEGSISYDGGAGFDTLIYAEGAETGDFSVAYNLGPGADEGSVLVSESGREQRLVFAGLEPIIDTVPNAELTLNATNADNQITYTQGITAASGVVSVDGFETIEFANKGTLVLNGLNGDDVITLANPSTPDGLTQILVDGGAASTGDRLVSIGVPGEFDPQIVQPTGLGAGTVTNNADVLPPVEFSGIESLDLVGQLEDDDTFAVNGTLGDDEFEYRPGLAPDRGTVTGTMDRTGAAYPLVNIAFEGMNQSTGLVFNFLGTIGGSDRFIYNGFETGETIGLSTSTGVRVRLEARGPSGVLLADLNAENMDEIFVNAHGGDDLIGFGAPVMAAVDTVTDGGAGNDAVLANLPGDSFLNFATAFGTFNIFTVPQNHQINGVERVATLGADATVTGTGDDDKITVSKGTSPAGQPALDVVLAGQLPLVQVSGGLAIDGGFSGVDTLTVRGDALNDVIDVSDTEVVLNGLNVSFGASIEQLLVEGLAGDDVLSVLTAPAIPLRVYGDEGADVLTGSDGDDYLDGGPGADFLDGNRGDDIVLGGSGSDEFAWNTNDGDDYFDGGFGSDLVTVGGRASADHIDVTAEGNLVRVERTNAAPFTLLLAAERLTIKGRAGADRILASPGLLPFVSLSIYGGGGADEIEGGDGNDLLKGGGGDDLIRGMDGGDRIYGDGGEDRLFGNDGADRFYANDNLADRVSGGAGSDWARLDLELDDFNAIELLLDG